MEKRELIGIWPGKERFVNIVWQVNDVCNYRCSYCNSGNWRGSFKNLQLDTYISVLEKIFNHFQTKGYKAFKVFFSGGEPSIWQPLVPICEYIRSKVDRPLLAINTNLSKPISWWKNNHHFFRDVVASFHVEYTDQKKFLETAEFLQYKIPYFALRILMHDQRFQEAIDFALLLKSKLRNYTIEYAPLFEHLSAHSEMLVYEEAWKNDFLSKHTLETKCTEQISTETKAYETYCVEVYSNGEIQTLNSNRIVSEGKNRFANWDCWINESIFICPNGDIKLASCNAGKLIGNMNQGTVEFVNGAIRCRERRCNCGTDINIRKAMRGTMPLLRRLGFLQEDANAD